MSIYLLTKNAILALPAGSLLSTQDIKVSAHQRTLVQKSVSDLFKSGVLRRLAKSLYYKPLITDLGEVPPSSTDIIHKLLELYKDKIAYLTGPNVYTRLGLTTQWTSEITLASDRPRREPLKMGGLQVRFVPSRVEVAEANTYLLQLLDAAKDIRLISGTTPTQVALQLQRLISKLSPKEKQTLVIYAQAYPASTRALLGMLLERMGQKRLAKKLKSTLSPLSVYTLVLESSIFPSAADWHFA